MLQLIGKEILTKYTQEMCLSKPVFDPLYFRQLPCVVQHSFLLSSPTQTVTRERCSAWPQPWPVVASITVVFLSIPKILHQNTQDLCSGS